MFHFCTLEGEAESRYFLPLVPAKSLVGVWYDLGLNFLGPGNPTQGALPEDDMFSLKGKSLALVQQ